MCFLRSVKGYTKLDKIRSKVMRKELEILFIYHLKYLLMTSFPGPDAFLRNLYLKLIISYVPFLPVLRNRVTHGNLTSFEWVVLSR
jgi:hypothetical protein